MSRPGARTGGLCPRRRPIAIPSLGQVLLIALALAMPGSAAAQTAGGLSLPRENVGREALSTQDGVMVLQSDGTSPDTGEPIARDEPLPPGDRDRSPVVHQIIIQVQPPAEAPVPVTAGPVHSADAEIRHAEQEVLYREAMDRLKDDDADVQVVIPTTQSPGAAGASAADTEIGRARSFEIIKEITDDNDEHRIRTIQIR